MLARDHTADNFDKNSSMEMATIRHSPELANVPLNIPSTSEEFLELEYLAVNEQEVVSCSLDKFVPFPLAAGDIIELPIKDVIQLSKGNDVKQTIDISFNISDKDFNFKPGDTVGIVSANPLVEVESILKCLGILETSRRPFKIHLKIGTKKKNAALPLFISGITNAQHLLVNCLEIRAPLKKLFVRALAECTAEPKEKRRLEELCSRQGAKEFAQFITEARMSLLDLLECFPSCCPPLTRLLEFLPRLSARPYSISSSPLIGPEFHIALSLQEFTNVFTSQEKLGVCSGWLFDATNQILKKKSLEQPDLSLAQQFENISLNKTEKRNKKTQQIQLFHRKSTEFCLPDDLKVPLIFIGPGTGVAPFVGFLQHRDLLQKEDPKLQFGEIWLFFGCRYEDRDFLYKDMISTFLESGVLSKLFVSFSREAHGKAKYVQDNIKLHSRLFVDQLVNKNAIVYVCGDATGMAKDVLQAIVDALQTENGITVQEAMQQVTDIKNAGRYRQDIWT